MELELSTIIIIIGFGMFLGIRIAQKYRKMLHSVAFYTLLGCIEIATILLIIPQGQEMYVALSGLYFLGITMLIAMIGYYYKN